MTKNRILLAAFLGEVITLGCALVIQSRAKRALVAARKREDDAIKVMTLITRCTDACTAVLYDQDVTIDQKLERLGQEFEFVTIAIEEAI